VIAGERSDFCQEFVKKDQKRIKSSKSTGFADVLKVQQWLFSKRAQINDDKLYLPDLIMCTIIPVS